MRVEVGRKLVERVGDQLLLPGPTTVDRVPADAGALRDRLDRRAQEAALGQQLEGGVYDRRACSRPARPTAGARQDFGTLRYRNILSYENV
jgi:hypothetical protein